MDVEPPGAAKPAEPDPAARNGPRSALAALRKFVRPRPVQERCDLCGAELVPEHPHLLDVKRRQLLCACPPCALLFSGSQSPAYRPVPRRLEVLAEFRLTDVQWESLLIPISLAFFVCNSEAGKVVALYPSPAGVTESLLPLETWRELVEENPVLRELEPDVEALLVNRVGGAREYYRVPIDECYKLAGIIRTRWHGLSGGTEVWDEIGRFFTSLKERSGASGEAAHA
jgi:hypothetical protein